MSGRHAVWRGLIVVFVMVAITIAFVVAALLAGPTVQALLVRAVVVSLIIFVSILFLRYFALLWFAYLGHSERNILGVRELHQLPGVSILVPAYNEGRVLERALESLIKLDYPEFEVLVIDDGSRDATLEIAAGWEGQWGNGEFRVITKPNGGKASALNAGIAHSKHPLIFCMDADSYLEARTLLRAARHFADPSVGAVAGQREGREPATGIVTRLQALEYIEGLNMPRRAQGFVAAVNIVPGPVGMFRREALEEVGGLRIRHVRGRRGRHAQAARSRLAHRIRGHGHRLERGARVVAGPRPAAIPLDPGDPPGDPEAAPHLPAAVPGLSRSGCRPSSSGSRRCVWPVMNVFAHLFFAIVALLFGAGELILYWMILLTLLDLVAALVTVSMEEESLALVPMALIYRFVFILFLDVVKMFATMEEVFRLEMGWGKLQRVAGT